MEKAELKLDYTLYRGTVPPGYDDLCQAAVNSVKSAYSPYSHFSVGAALLLKSGDIICGSNQENIAYPSGLCAERVALYAAASAFPGIGIDALAITAFNEHKVQVDMVTPCGACRQVICEFVKRYESDFDVIMVGRERTMVVKATSLLPFAFQF